MTKAQKSYRQLRDELDAIMAWFEQDDIDIDLALAKHTEAEVIISELEAYLAQTEAKIQKLKP